MRYPNRAGEFDEDRPFRELAGEALSGEQVGRNVFYPCFGRVVQRHHKVPTKVASGYTDKLLFAHPKLRNTTAMKRSHCVVTEGKTPWVYTNRHFRDILHGGYDILDPENLHFRKSRMYQKHGGNSLLKQVRVY